MKYAICIVPAAPVRKKSSHKAEMSNQLLFGEMMRIIKAKKNWMKVQSLHDNYEGWIRNNLVAPLEDTSVNNLYVAGEMVNSLTMNGNNMLIPFGASLPAFRQGEGMMGTFSYRFNGYAFNRNDAKPAEDLTRQLSLQWLNVPYLWGGRTPMGVDCSGFVQIIFKMMGVDLLRDAKEQITQGLKIKKREDAKCGDLAFFEKKGKIVHVGIVLSPGEIIHASGKVRIDKMDSTGIINVDTGKRTHSLAGIRRYG